MFNPLLYLVSIMLTPFISLPMLLVAPIVEVSQHKQPPAAEITSSNGGHLDLPEALDMSCTECRIVLYGSVWELLVPLGEETRISADDMVNMDVIFVANGTEYIRLGESKDSGSMVFATPGVGDINLMFNTKSQRPEGNIYPSEAFYGTGFNGTVYHFENEQGDPFSTLYFWTPDNKYEIGVSGYGEQFTEFIKAIKLQK